MKGADLLMDSDSEEYTKAMEQYKQCISLLDVTIPGNFYTHSELLVAIALCHLSLNQHNACIQSCDQSLAINPCNLGSIRLRASAYSRKKDPASMGTAYESYELATVVEPSCKPAQEGLAQTAKALRSLHGEHWRQYVKPKPSIPKGPVFLPAPASQSPSSSHSSVTSVTESVDSVTKDPASLLLDNTQDKTTTLQPRDVTDSKTTSEGSISSDVDTDPGEAQWQPAVGSDENMQFMFIMSKPSIDLHVEPIKGWIVARVATMMDKQSFLKPLRRLPFEYTQKDIFMFNDKLSTSILPVKEGDLVECVLGIKDVNRPFATQAKAFVYCAERDKDEVDDYLRFYRNMLSDRTTCHTLLVATLSATSQWYFLANAETEDPDYPLSLLSLVTETLKVATDPSLKELLKTTIKVFLDGQVFNKLKKECQDNVAVAADVMCFCEVVLSILPMLLPSVLSLIENIKNTPPITKEKEFLYNILMLTQACRHDIRSWKHLSQMLRGEELLGNFLEESSTLKSVLIDVPYSNCEEYMDIYYRLMRTECFAAIQKGILDLKKGQLDSRDMNCFKDVYIMGHDVTGYKVQLALQFKPNKLVTDWRKTSQLMYGNLVCLSPNNQFTDPIWATVSNRDVDLLNKSSVICVVISDFNDKPLGHMINILQANGGRTIMVESPNYFESFKSILKTLQSSDIASCSLSDQIVFSIEGDIPRYQLKQDIPEKYEDITKDLETNQGIAFDYCLESSLGIIQGPPGTGKTYIGTKLVELLLEYKLDSPILILTYKNHALDEFLLKVLKFCDARYVTRIGGQSKDPEIEKLLLKNIIDHSDRISTKDINDELEDLSKELGSIFKKYERMKYFSYHNFISQLTADDQLKVFITDAEWNIRTRSHRGYMITQQWIKFQLSLIEAVVPLTDAMLDVNVIRGIQGVDPDFINIVYNLYRSWLPSKETLSNLLELEKQYMLSEVADEVEKQDYVEQDQRVIDDADEDLVREQEVQRMSATSDKNKQNHLVLFDEVIQQKANNAMFSIADFPSWCKVDYSLKKSKNIWQLSDIQKYKLILTALKDSLSEIEERFERCFSKITVLQAEKNLKSNEIKVSALSRMKVIGATITGASIHSSILQLVAPKILIVEEAAEILEPALLAALNPSLEHLILIGDHKQLRPIVDTYYLTKEFKFDISMMERLISTGFPFKALTKQGRMRPEFSALLKDIYPELQNFQDLERDREPHPCISTTMFFWNHEYPEQKDRSVRNSGEACMAIALALFMICNGADPSQITIITSYLGQLKELRSQYRNVKQGYSALFTDHPEKDVQIQTIDMYQGDENDYVIVSLVRSPKEGYNIGFVNNESRRCVAQSRSKCGLYFIGNVRVLKKSKVWYPLIAQLEAQNCVGKKLSIVCDKHRTGYQVDQVNDPPQITDLMYFVTNPTILCKEVCGADYPCLMAAHKCRYTCKPVHGHSYCKTVVTFNFSTCSHIVEKHCSKDVSLMKCLEKVNKTFSCQHVCEFSCFETLKPLTCTSPCASVNNCDQSHPCDQICGAPHGHNDCKTLIFYKYSVCGHDAPKQKECSQPINPKWKCRQVVEFTGKCGHPLSRDCSHTESLIVCKVPCVKLLGCGHPCRNKCGEPCGTQPCQPCAKVLKRRIQEFKDLAQAELKELEKAPVQIERLDLKQGSAEYTSVEDKTLKYVQPSHNWCPVVTRIEKVSNTEQLKKFQEVKITGFGDYVDLKFHGTDDEGIEGITKEGFKLPERAGMFGKGLYFATDSSKSAQDRYTKGSNKFLLCDVFLGDCLVIRGAPERVKFISDTSNRNHRGQEKWHLRKKLKKDSIFAPRGTEVAHDEFVVFDVRQAIPKYIVHYEGGGQPELHRPPNPTGFKIHKYKISREVDRADPYYIEANIALGHFYRTFNNKEVASIDIVQNTALEQQFCAKKQEFLTCGVSSKEILAYHGTSSVNIDSILRDNLDPTRAAAHGRKHGDGCYFSEFPKTSIDYGDGLILFRVLPGKEHDGSGTQPIPADCHSKRVSRDIDGYGDMLIITDAAQFLPAYVIHMK